MDWNRVQNEFNIFVKKHSKSRFIKRIYKQIKFVHKIWTWASRFFYKILETCTFRLNKARMSTGSFESKPKRPSSQTMGFSKKASQFLQRASLRIKRWFNGPKNLVSAAAYDCASCFMTYLARERSGMPRNFSAMFHCPSKVKIRTQHRASMVVYTIIVFFNNWIYNLLWHVSVPINFLGPLEYDAFHSRFCFDVLFSCSFIILGLLTRTHSVPRVDAFIFFYLPSYPLAEDCRKGSRRIVNLKFNLSILD